MNWTTSSETNGYVIEYTTGGLTNVVSSSENEILLTDLSSISTYTISVYSYIDLPSVSTIITVLLSSDSKLPSITLSLFVFQPEPTNTTTPSYYYTSVSSATPSVSVTPSISDTSDSVIALGVSVGVLLILLTVIVTINIYCFIRFIIIKNHADNWYIFRMKDSFTMGKDPKLVLH